MTYAYKGRMLIRLIRDVCLCMLIRDVWKGRMLIRDVWI